MPTMMFGVLGVTILFALIFILKQLIEIKAILKSKCNTK
jgi:hypothetical protein